MSISKEFLMEAVGLALLVALLFIGVQMFQRATKIAALLEEGQERQISELEEYEIVKYDGLSVDGLTAVSYIKRMTGNYELPVKVVTKTKEFVVSDRSECSELRDINSMKYIPPLVKYRCEVRRDENGAISEIELRAEGE